MNIKKSALQQAEEQLGEQFRRPDKRLVPKARIDKSPRGKMIYIKVFDKNHGKNGGNVTIAKISVETSPMPNISDFIENYTTETYKNDCRFHESITHNVYIEVKRRVDKYSKLIAKIKSEALHTEDIVVVSKQEREVSSLARPIHDVCDVVEEMMKGSKLTINEAEEIYQAWYRLKRRIESAGYSVADFNDYEFALKENVPSTKRDPKDKIEEFLASFESLTPFTKREYFAIHGKRAPTTFKEKKASPFRKRLFEKYQQKKAEEQSLSSRQTEETS